MAIKLARIKQSSCRAVFVFLLEKQMILHSDSVNACALEHICLYVGVIFVGRAAMVLPAKPHPFVDAELVVGKILFCRLKAPFDKIGLVVKRGYSIAPFHFVGHLDRWYLIRVALGDLTEAALYLALCLFDTLASEPNGEESIVCQRVLSRLYAILLAEFDAKIGSGTAVYLAAVL